MLQIAEMAGRLQHAEQSNVELLAHLTSASLPSPSQKGPDTALPAHASPGPDSTGAGPCHTASLEEGQPQAALSSSSVQWLRTDAARELGSSSSDDPDVQQGTDTEGEAASQGAPASHDGSSAAPSGQEVQQQQPSQVPQSSGRQSEPSTTATHSHTDSQSGTSSIALQKSLRELADTLAIDVNRLKKVLDSRFSAEPECGKAANWGFAKPEAVNSPGPSRPVTAGPCDSMQRLNRQWSAGTTRQESSHQHAAGAEYRQGRPVTTAAHGKYAQEAAGMSRHDAVGRQSNPAVNRRSKHGKEQDVWHDPVPPTRMPEEILQQAREDYMKEKNRVRDKRMQELAAKTGEGPAAAGS